MTTKKNIPAWKKIFPKKGSGLCQICNEWYDKEQLKLVCYSDENTHCLMCPKCEKEYEGV